MTSVTMYAIQHMPTGHFLPRARGVGARDGRGGSHVEPIAPTNLEPPRLFHSEHAAKMALTHWLKGKVTVTMYQSYEGEVDESWHIEPVPSRKKVDMKIIPVSLSW